MNYKIKTEFNEELAKLKEIVKKINRDNKSQNKKFEWIFLPIRGPRNRRQ